MNNQPKEAVMWMMAWLAGTLLRGTLAAWHRHRWLQAECLTAPVPV
jgi:hypothetical protein